MQNNDFFIQKQKAVERMKEMQRSSAFYDSSEPPMPPFVSRTRGNTQKKPPENSGGGVLPFLHSGDKDTALLLGVFLLLSSEKADRLLLYALLYILM